MTTETRCDKMKTRYIEDTMMNRYDDQKGKVFALLMNQCDEPVKNKIDSHEDYAKAEKDRDVIALLVKIKTESHNANNEDTKIRIMEHLCGKLQPIALDGMDVCVSNARSTDIRPMNALTMMIRMMIRHQNNNTCNKNSNPLDGCDSVPKIHR